MSELVESVFRKGLIGELNARYIDDGDLGFLNDIVGSVPNSNEECGEDVVFAAECLSRLLLTIYEVERNMTIKLTDDKREELGRLHQLLKDARAAEQPESRSEVPQPTIGFDDQSPEKTLPDQTPGHPGHPGPPFAPVVL